MAGQIKRPLAGLAERIGFVAADFFATGLLTFVVGVFFIVEGVEVARGDELLEMVAVAGTFRSCVTPGIKLYPNITGTCVTVRPSHLKNGQKHYLTG